MQSLRATLILTLFFAFTLPMMLVQWALLRLSRDRARAFPRWYHRQVCRLVGVRIHVTGRVAEGRPVLLAANHVSWLDIPVLSAVAPLSFVAKREVDSWPFVRRLARLQRTVFVDRTRRGAVEETARAITDRLREGDTIVLFAEGTSSDGNGVLPFRSSLFAAVKPGGKGERALAKGIYLQTLALAYTHLYGLPLGRRGRPGVAWYGDMDLGSHAWRLLGKGPLDVRIRISEPVKLDRFLDRKALADYAQAQVRRDVAQILTPCTRPRETC